nr:reverse transcriptase domain-containing protein [Tanacetum cinerariifolium]
MSPYNGIIGRPGLKAIQAVPSTVHGMLKFPVEGGIATIRSTILIPIECASVTTSSVTPREKRTRPANFIVNLHPDFPDQEVVIGGPLSDKGRTELCSVLKKNLDIFAWQPSDMTGVPRSVAEHRLNIREGYTPVRQKKRGQAPERARAIQADVQKLVDVGIMREVYYHDWLSNPVMVKKHDGSWRMCVDFTDLNRACPQDCYPLPEIDWKVESLCGYPFKCFLDAYKGYHQIQLADADEEKTAFHTGQGVYCYTKMPFGLKNAGATYQRLMDKAKISAAVSDLKKCIKKSDFRWTAEAEQAFQQLKQHLSELPLLVAPKPQEELIMYLSATYGAVSAVLMTKRGTTQTAAAKVGHYAGRAQYYIQTEDVDQRANLSRFFLIEMPGDVSQAAPAAVIQQEPWTLFTDGSSCVDGSGAGLILTNPEGVEFTYALRFQFAASNNEAEYEALVAGLRIATQMGVKNIQVLVEVLENKSIKENEVAAVIEEDGPTWMTQIADYLKEGVLSGDNKEARKLRLKARSYSMHAGPRSVVAKAIRLGYYWSTMHKDARDIIRKCNDCQIHHPVTRHPQQSLTPITAPWPFYKWGIDIAGPFPEGPGKVKFLIVAIDYFMKWVEAKAVATITGGQGKKFVCDNIVCRFGIPGEIISDNGKQFADNPFKDWCDKLNITQRFASVKHPQSNRLVERANRSLGEGIKAHLGEVITAEIGMPTYRTAAVDVVNNDKELRLNLDLLEEHRERAAVCEARAKSKMMKYYNARVRGVAFKPGDFVYRSNDASHAVAGGKLGPKWEGPYEVTGALGNGAYKLRSTDGTVLPKTWNVTNLKRCYL